MGKLNLSPETKLAIKASTGIDCDSELTPEDARKAYEYIREIAKQFNPDIDDDVDAAIDRIEAVAMKRKPIAKMALMTMASGIRKVLGIPDDDDNITQK